MYCYQYRLTKFLLMVMDEYVSKHLLRSTTILRDDHIYEVVVSLSYSTQTVQYRVLLFWWLCEIVLPQDNLVCWYNKGQYEILPFPLDLLFYACRKEGAIYGHCGYNSSYLLRGFLPIAIQPFLNNTYMC